MSSYIQNIKHPKTGKEVKALFIDDFYGSHQYGVGFRKDGTDAGWDDIMNEYGSYEFYRKEDLKK